MTGMIPADVSVARAELVATAMRWHGSESWAPELHRAVERYRDLRDMWLATVSPPEPPS